MRLLVLLMLVGLMADRVTAQEPPVTTALATIKKVGREGQGNEEATKAWKTLVGSGGSALLPTLAAFNDANPTAANWLRSAVDAIVQSEEKAGRKLPAKELQEFVNTKTNDPSARRIAYELFATLEKETAEKLILTMVEDPSLELRRDAIAKTLAEAKEDAAKIAPLFTAARDKAQVEAIAKTLKKTEADISAHFGFVTSWHIVGPFDSTKGEGFAASHAPEKSVDLKATYKSKNAEDVSWKPVTAKSEKNEYALVDLNKELGKHKDSASYAYTEIEVAKETVAELRAGSTNAVKIFLNGKEVFAREEYHHGTRMDQHIAKVTLKAGKNTILLKVCQNNQQESWAQSWVYQLRICDATGGAIAFQQTRPEGK